MDLLPKDHTEFSTENYWNYFFTKRKSQPFEWYGEYNTLCEVLDKYIQTKDKVLIIGCGNSKLSVDLYNVGFFNLTNIDISDTVISQMKEKYSVSHPKMIFEKMDLFEMTYPKETFGVILDKGTLDALFVDNSLETRNKIDAMFCEIDRVLRYGGRYICVSLLQEHILHKILDYFIDKGWLVRIHRCEKAETPHDQTIKFPIFVVVLTKMKKNPNLPMILELVHLENTSPKRCNSKQEVLDFVKSAQHYAFLRYYLNKEKMVADNICLELCSPDGGAIKYRMFVVDRSEPSSLKFAIFIVPQGRETEWLFASKEGHLELAANANCERLIVVHLLRNIVYKDIEEVKNDLSKYVMELAPSSNKSRVPILSLGEDVGTREIKCNATSELSGDYVIEDVLSENNEMFRRLIFLNHPNFIQSEARLIMGKKKKKGSSKKKFEIDFNYLSCNHHAAIVSSLSFLNFPLSNVKLLLIGLGGGSLSMYLYKHFPHITLDVVELDPAIVEVAKKWFGFISSERLIVHIGDGLVFIEEAIKKDLHYDVVIIDVDNKDLSLGMSGPPMDFFEPNVLNNISHLISKTGIVIMNLACRNLDLRLEAYSKLKSVFNCIYFQAIPNEINEILCCFNYEKTFEILSMAKSHSKELSNFFKHQAKNVNEIDIIDLVSHFKEIL